MKTLPKTFAFRTLGCALIFTFSTPATAQHLADTFQVSKSSRDMNFENEAGRQSGGSFGSFTYSGLTEDSTDNSSGGDGAGSVVRPDGWLRLGTKTAPTWVKVSPDVVLSDENGFISVEIDMRPREFDFDGNSAKASSAITIGESRFIRPFDDEALASLHLKENKFTVWAEGKAVLADAPYAGDADGDTFRSVRITLRENRSVGKIDIRYFIDSSKVFETSITGPLRNQFLSLNNYTKNGEYNGSNFTNLAVTLSR